MENLQPNPKVIRLFYFWAGVIATITYRAIIILNYYSPFWVKVFWYIGTVGFVIYFAHRFSIAKKRSRLITDHNLLYKLDNPGSMTKEDHDALAYILKATVSSKAKWNYYVIFVSSGIALILGIIFDFVL